MTSAIVGISSALAVIGAIFAWVWYKGQNSALDSSARLAAEERLRAQEDQLRAAQEAARKRDLVEAGTVDSPGRAIGFLRDSFPREDDVN